MMRAGDKLASYRVLAEALQRAKLKRPILLIAGDGEAKRDVKRAFADAPCRVRIPGRRSRRTSWRRSMPPPICWSGRRSTRRSAWRCWRRRPAALPVLAGAFGGVAGIVADGKTGFLTEPGDVKDFAAGLKRALASDLPAARPRGAAQGGAAARYRGGVGDLRAHARQAGGQAMTLIVALRHAPTAWNRDQRLQGRTDVALDEEGVAVAARWRIDPDWAGYRILSSPLQRARMTAAILFPDAEIGIDRRLIEMDFGTWEGKRLAELRADPTEDAAAREGLGLDFKAPEGESPREVQDAHSAAAGAAGGAASGRPCWSRTRP